MEGQVHDCSPSLSIPTTTPLDTIRLSDNNPCHLPAMEAGLEVPNA